MKRFRHYRLKPMLLLSAALLLRAIIPAGYMPAAAGSGLLFELCPESVSAEFAQFLTGDSGPHHSHIAHGDGVQDNHQCEFGHILLSSVAVDDTWQAELAAPVPSQVTAGVYSFSSVSRIHYRSRGPPA